METFFYAGIGARKTPSNILQQMMQMASELEQFNAILRSGAANGADTAFEDGVMNYDNKAIYLPWSGFNGRRAKASDGTFVPFYTDYDLCNKANEIAARYHPAWERCSSTVKSFHRRNVAQVLGDDLKTPSRFVVCWTEGGLRRGGTGQALRIAEAHDIPIFDFGSMSLDQIERAIEKELGL